MSRRPRPLPAALLLVVVAALLLAGCSGGPGASQKPSTSHSSTPSSAASGPAGPSSPTSTAPAVPPAPRQAACYRLTVPQLTQPTNASTPVPCRGAHTAQTIYVGTLDT
ncbi:MAG TPA: hypothetical protein VFP51_15485, partial [Nocardioidaceae bacterium]|nr:hypothetical protein [Nocardioidaceae bacterium]